MFTHALVALDVSPVERPLIACLPALKKWGLQQITLLHVMPLGLLQGAALAHEDDYRDWLDQQAQPLRDAGIAVHCVLTANGDAATEILAQSAVAGCDFVIVGSRGQNLVRKLFLGSVARAVIRQSDKPVLLEWIEPDPDAAAENCHVICSDTLAHIVVATDFSVHASAAEQAAIFLSPRSQKTSCLHVLTKDDSKYGIGNEKAQELIYKLEARMATDTSKVSSIILEGKACQQIARYASEQQATLIIVGKLGQGCSNGNLIGSTAANVCEMAGRPILVMP